MALVRAAVPGRTRWRRRIPAGLLAGGLAVLAIGAARPQATVPVRSSSATILLALDVSASMCATDVRPNRISAAQKAASDFIRSQADGPLIGLVEFAGTAGLLVRPTHDTQKLLGAVSGLTTSSGTAIGEAILISLDAISQVDPAVAPLGARTENHVGGASYVADAIVLLTDGANNEGVDPQIAARQAASRRVRVYTIGFGTTHPETLECAGSEFNGFTGVSGFGTNDGRNPLSVDEDALKRIAATTGAKYYRAQQGGQLQNAFRDLPSTITVVYKRTDIAAWFAGAGGLLIAIAVALSLWWNQARRPPRRAAQ
jgi:Ca-activated chloride channel family protein